jgi:hypothetical protein
MKRHFRVLFAAIIGTTSACNGGGGGTATEPEGSTGGTGTTASSTPMTTTTDTSTGAPVTSTSESPTSGEPMTSTSTSEASTGGTTNGDETTVGGMPVEKPCGNMTYQCGDTIDNDMDGAIDGGDKECTSPCDDSEGSLQTNLPGQNQDCKNDCYWDDDSGVGNDHCEYDLQCDPLNPGGEIGCEFKMECAPDVPDICLEVCSDLTPNGCDCFGCCHVATPDGNVDVFLGSNADCSLANIEACGKCTFQAECNNTCDECELCFGEEELPDGCNPEDSCDEGDQPCKIDKFGVDNCLDGFYCQTGCCQPILPG